ncbi:MAG TPA: ABC transporter substrate-binding protein [Anaerolineae bacterium]|nr:ABC transporter substrate-binding protein [Anaerolineae bacterium]
MAGASFDMRDKESKISRRGSRRLARRSILCLVVVALAFAAWLLMRSLRPVDETRDRILETGVLRVCTDPSWPPFESVDPTTGQVVGLDADLAHLLAPRIAPGVKAEFVVVGFDSLYDALAASRCDVVLSALPYEAARTRDVSYSISYFNAGPVIVVREGTEGINAVQDLPGRVVGVEWGYVPEGEPKEKLILQQLGLRRYDTAGEALRALQAGELEAAIVDRISALVYLHQCEGLRFAGEPIVDVNYSIPVRPDAVLLIEEINHILLEMRRDGTLDRLQDKWF